MAAENGNRTPSRVQIVRTLLIVAVVALQAIGLVIVYSVTSVDLVADGESPWGGVINQAIFVVVGIVGAVVLWRFVPYEVWGGGLCWIAWGICMLLLAATAAFGTDYDMGAKRWLVIGPFSLQPSEFIKIGLLLMMIRIMFDARQGNIEVRAAIVQFVLFVAMPLVILYVTQSDLGTTLICVVGIFAVLWLGGVSWKALLVIMAVVFGAAVYAIFGTGYRSDRLVFLDPWNDGMGGYDTGYNIIRAYYAIASGGLFGKGLGASHEKFEYLFGRESDFIFAIIAEETGLFGALLVIALFLVVLYAGLQIAGNAPDDLGKMLSGGFAIMLVFQAFLNIGCTIGVFPTTGKPLPFISSGGTAIISSLLIVGFMLSVARAAERPSVYERARDDLRIVRGGASIDDRRRS